MWHTLDMRSYELCHPLNPRGPHDGRFRWVSAQLIFFLAFNLLGPLPAAKADEMLLPKPGTMMTTSPAFSPAIITGMTIHPENPLQFDFIVDTGDDRLQGDALKRESQKLINYFMATLTVPDEEMWVNLSPYEKNRIVADGLGKTEMGRDMLAQDYILKQLTASLIYPEEELGKVFWQKVYAKAKKQFGTTQVPTNLFNKVWIVPQDATVYVNEKNVFVTGSHLKVMLEEDYVALDKKSVIASEAKQSLKKLAMSYSDPRGDKFRLGSQIVREIVLPALEKEVNEGKNFANLRQIYNSMILASWYKKKLHNSLFDQVYLNKNKTNGIDLGDKNVKEKIYKQYLSAYKKGVFNFIKEDRDPQMNAVIPRKYFSGGLEGVRSVQEMGLPSQWITEQSRKKHAKVSVNAGLIKNGNDGAMLSAEIYVVEGKSTTQEIDFDDALKDSWVSRKNIPGLYKDDPDSYQVRRVGALRVDYSTKELFGVTKEPNPPGPVVRAREAGQFAFTKADVRTRLMRLNIADDRITVVANNAPILPYHFMLIPQLEDQLPQDIREKDILATLQLARHSNNAHLKFTHNSFRAAGSVNNLHIHGFYYHEERLPIENAAIKVMNDFGDWKVGEIQDFPARGFLFEGDDYKISQAARRLINTLQQQDIPYNVLMMKGKVYILPRSSEDVEIEGKYYRLGYLAMAGELMLPTKAMYEGFSEQQIGDVIRKATLGENEFDTLVKSYDFNKEFSELSEISKSGVMYAQQMKGAFEQAKAKAQEQINSMAQSVNQSRDMRVSKIINIFLADSPVVRSLASRIMSEVNVVLGDAQKAQHMRLEDLHSTMATYALYDGQHPAAEKQVASLDDIAEILPSLKALEEFDIEVVGGAFTPGYGIVLELTTSAPQVKQMRDMIQAHVKPAEGQKLLIPNILHATVTFVLHATPQQIQEINLRLTNINNDFQKKTLEQRLVRVKRIGVALLKARVAQDKDKIYFDLKDKAMTMGETVKEPIGGIDLNAGHLNLKENGHGENFNFFYEDFKGVQPDAVIGAVPMIVGITDVHDFESLLKSSTTPNFTSI